MTAETGSSSFRLLGWLLLGAVAVVAAWWSFESLIDRAQDQESQAHFSALESARASQTHFHNQTMGQIAF